MCEAAPKQKLFMRPFGWGFRSYVTQFCLRVFSASSREVAGADAAKVKGSCKIRVQFVKVEYS